MTARSTSPLTTGAAPGDERLTGILAFPLTSFDDTLEVDLDGTAENVERHVAAGAGAIFLACGTGEFSSLGEHELLALWARARQVIDGRVPLWVGVGGGAGTARALLHAARDAGADGALLLPPYLVTGPPAGLDAYVGHVTAANPLPVVVYHRGTAVFGPDTATALLERPSVVGLKDGYGSVELMTRIVTAVRASGHPRAQRFLFFNGLPTAEVSAPAYAAVDVARYSSAVHCFAPELAQRFYDALHGGEQPVVDALLSRFYLPLVALRDETPGFAVSLVKAAAGLRGHRVGGVRPPLVMPTDDQLNRLEAILAEGDAVLREVTG